MCISPLSHELLCARVMSNTNSFLSYLDVTSAYTSIWALAQPVKCGWAQMSSHVLACEWHEQWECSWARIPFLPAGPTNPNVALCALRALLTCDTLHTIYCTLHVAVQTSPWHVQFQLHTEMFNFQCGSVHSLHIVHIIFKKQSPKPETERIVVVCNEVQMAVQCSF